MGKGIFAEKIYDELPNPIEVDADVPQNWLSCNNPFIRSKLPMPNRFGHDEHEYQENEGGEGEGENRKQIDHDKHEHQGAEGKREIDWKQKLSEAYVYARQRGNVPARIGQLIDELLYPKLNWRELLQRFVSQAVVTDWTWTRPHKKRLQSKFYFPDVLKEAIDVVVHIDTSGSITNEELKQFVSEVKGMLLSFERVKVKLIMADCEVHAVYDLNNSFNLNKVRMVGRGGTSHIPVFDYIEREVPECRLLISFTDAHSIFPTSPPRYPVIWALIRQHGEVPNWGEKVIVEL